MRKENRQTGAQGLRKGDKEPAQSFARSKKGQTIDERGRTRRRLGYATALELSLPKLKKDVGGA